MTERDIKGNFLAIRHLADQVAGADLPDNERAVIKKTLVESGLNLLEQLLLDINKIANAADEQLNRQ